MAAEGNDIERNIGGYTHQVDISQPRPALFMSAYAAIVNSLLREASSQRFRPLDPIRTARVHIGFSGLCPLVSRRSPAILRRIVMNNAG